MSNRRVFDIDFPDYPLPPQDGMDVPAGTGDRRGPMATAIVENAEALAERTSAEAAIRAENDRLAHEHVRLKNQGLIADLVPIDRISMTKLTRDRRIERDPDLEELKASIVAIGLSNPIRVEADGQGGYELVQGYRRLAAYRDLHAETGDERYARIPAGLLASGAELDDLYRRMVDENLVRRDISFGEMALLVLRYSEDHPEQGGDLAEISDRLYSSASRQKRGHIRTFVRLMSHIGGALRFPEAIPRALGSDLAKRIDEDPEIANDISAHLGFLSADASADDELGVLKDAAYRTPPEARMGAKARAQGRTTLKLKRPEGVARCTASDGKVELRLTRDFSTIERARLETAMVAFFDALDGDQ